MYTQLADTPDFLIIDKHAGTSFHSEGDEKGLLEIVRSDVDCPLWPVHRLDKATSGLLILAKSQESCRELCELFAQKKVQKFYLAISDCAAKKIKKKQGAIVGDMARTRNGSWKLVNTRSNPAITHFFSYSVAPKQRLFILKPHTGKTHQLRVALKSIGAPILGDTRYGSSQTSASRMALHAYQLQFSFAGVSYNYESLPNTDVFLGIADWLQAQAIDTQTMAWPRLR